MAKTKVSTKMNQVYVGLKTHKLLVTKDLGTVKRNDGRGTRHTYECLCDCGRSTVVDQNNLRPGAKHPVRSCGCLREQKWATPEKISFLCVYRRYKNCANAKRKGFSLTEEQFRELTQKNCCYCGIKPSQVSQYNYRPMKKYPQDQWTADPYIYNGIDRIDSSIGYTESNCVPCCGKCNIAKSDMSQKEFVEWLLRAAAHIRENR